MRRGASYGLLSIGPAAGNTSTTGIIYTTTYRIAVDWQRFRLSLAEIMGVGDGEPASGGAGACGE
jgi:hypothetical protein